MGIDQLPSRPRLEHGTRGGRGEFFTDEFLHHAAERPCVGKLRFRGIDDSRRGDEEFALGADGVSLDGRMADVWREHNREDRDGKTDE